MYVWMDGIIKPLNNSKACPSFFFIVLVFMALSASWGCTQAGYLVLLRQLVGTQGPRPSALHGLQATTASTTYLGSSIEDVATPLGVQTPSAGASPTPNVPNSQSTLIYLPISFFLAAGTSGPVNISVSYSNGAMSVSSDPYTINLCGRLASCNPNF
jgi:hypothetical protein